jgi:hypothetical protein
MNGHAPLWLAAALCLAVSLTPWGPLLLYPFTLFSTWVHECGHAVMVVLTGGSVTAITIEPDTSGLTQSLMPHGRIARGLVASSGYLGASIVGCLLMAAARVQKRARPILWSIGAFMLFTVVIWMRNVFGALVVLAWGVALVALARNASGRASRFVLSVLAIQVALNAVFSIRTLFLVDGPSDADTMARLFAAPAWLWAATWMIASVAMLAWTLRATRLPLARRR